jgi:hypothetical protein
MSSEAKQDGHSPPITDLLAIANAAGSPSFLLASKSRLQQRQAGLESAHRIQTLVAVVVLGFLGMMVGSPFGLVIESRLFAASQGADE